MEIWWKKRNLRIKKLKYRNKFKLEKMKKMNLRIKFMKKFLKDLRK